MPSASCYLAVEKWDEDRTNQTTPRVTPAHIAYTIAELAGVIESEYLMTYTDGGNASFIFTDTVKVGAFAGKKGSFITQGTGSFDKSSFTVTGSFDIVHCTGTDELQGVKGRGSFKSAPTKEQPGRVEWACTVQDS